MADKKGSGFNEIWLGEVRRRRVSRSRTADTTSAKQKKKSNMKNNLLKGLIGSGLALALAATIWSPVGSSAQQIKGAQLLTQAPAVAANSAAASTMACPTCKTELTNRTDATVRGAVKTSVAVAEHLCASCQTTSKTVGVGRQAKSIPSHTCAMGGSAPAGCCN
jgi:hypothetical protein